MVTKSNVGGGTFEDALNAMKIPGVGGEKPEVTEANRMMNRPEREEVEETTGAAAISGGPMGVAGTAGQKKMRRVQCPSCDHNFTVEV